MIRTLMRFDCCAGHGAVSADDDYYDGSVRDVFLFLFISGSGTLRSFFSDTLLVFILDPESSLPKASTKTSKKPLWSPTH